MAAIIPYWKHLASVFSIAVSIVASCHVVLHKRDSRSATGWVGVVWLVPIIGTLLYFLLGINRIRRRARVLRQRAPQESLSFPAEMIPEEDRAENLFSLSGFTHRVTGLPLVPENRISPFVNGERAYPAMLEQIEAARESIELCTYIFNRDETGEAFLKALVRAHGRGVKARVLIDGVGAKYSFPSIVGAIRRSGVRVAEFIPTFVPWRFPYFNLRNHRKLLVVDRKIAFTGGMNIQSGPTPAHPRRRIIQDLHFRVEGPLVHQLYDVFSQDWSFVTGEPIADQDWPPNDRAGAISARVIPDGPDEDFEKIKWTMLGAIGCARESVQIVTPYFLPDTVLVSALNVAAMRGVEVTVIVPEKNNLSLVQWASTSDFRELIEYGVRIFLRPPPFDHTKLMLVDGGWALLGSANWDPRSFRLNFELNIECYDREFVAECRKIFESKLRGAHEVTLAEVNGRKLWVRLRDGFSHLLSPYL